MKRSRVVVLVSGGLDSVTALYHSVQQDEVVAALSFSYGSKHNERELPLARWHCQHLGVPHVTLSLSFMGEHFCSDLLLGQGEIPTGHYQEASMKRTVVPFRNGIMLAVAAGWAESAGAEAVVIAAHGGDHAVYPDCRPEFMQAMAAAMTAGTYAGIKLFCPFMDWDKAAIVKRGHTLGVDFRRTWSCYRGGERHCGQCGTCVERREAFLLAGLADPTEYESQSPLPPRPEGI